MFPTQNDCGTDRDKKCIATFCVCQAGPCQAGLIFNYFIRK